MAYDDAFLNSVPRFLRRAREPGPQPPVRFAAADTGPALSPCPARAQAIHGGQAPIAPYGQDAPRLNTRPTSPPSPALMEPAASERTVPPARKRPFPWLARKTAAPPEDTQDQGDVVDLTAHRADAPGAPAQAHGPRGQQAELETAFGAELATGTEAERATGTEAEPGTEADGTGDEDDVAFQVTLPRSVIRQIRMRAARDETTHRAIVLRALRAAGLSIPEGADVDRRVLAAKRRQQA